MCGSVYFTEFDSFAVGYAKRVTEYFMIYILVLIMVVLMFFNAPSSLLKQFFP